jgi:hypothetical protein
MTKTEIEAIAHYAACQAVCAAHREAAYLAADPNRKCPEACEVADTCPLMQGMIEVEYDDTLPLTQLEDSVAKILISQGYGAGWSTWNSGDDSQEFRKFILTHPGLIAAIENGETLDEQHPAFVRFLEELTAKFGEVRFYAGGLDGLCVEEVYGAFRVGEYAGDEYVINSDGVVVLEDNDD